jgi:hypothetical protein
VNGYFDSLNREADKDGAFVRPSFGLLSDSPLPFILLASVRDAGAASADDTNGT